MATKFAQTSHKTPQTLVLFLRAPCGPPCQGEHQKANRKCISQDPPILADSAIFGIWTFILASRKEMRVLQLHTDRYQSKQSFTRLKGNIPKSQSVKESQVQKFGPLPSSLKNFTINLRDRPEPGTRNILASEDKRHKR